MDRALDNNNAEPTSFKDQETTPYFEEANQKNDKPIHHVTVFEKIFMSNQEFATRTQDYSQEKPTKNLQLEIEAVAH